MPSIRLCKPKNSIDITLGAAYLINIVPIEPCSSSRNLDRITVGVALLWTVTIVGLGLVARFS